MAKKIRICTLVYVDESKTDGLPNNKSTDLASSYFLQAFALNRSLLANDLPSLTIYTNRIDIGEKIHAANSSLPINFCQLIFNEWVPGKVGFYQAHYKIDLLKQVYDTLEEDEILLLLDTDILCLKKFNTDVIGGITSAAYNISDQCFQTYGFERVRSDLNFLTDQELVNPAWYGGEFLIGDREFLKKLIHEINFVLPRYIKAWRDLHHHGDESIISSALNRLPANTFLDVTPLNVVNRFWTVRTKHTQRSIGYALESVFLHLPSEKGFLESLAKGSDHIGRSTIAHLYFRSAFRSTMSKLKYMSGLKKG